MYLHFMCVCVIKLFKCFTLLREPGGSPEVGVSELKVINLYTISSQSNIGTKCIIAYKVHTIVGKSNRMNKLIKMKSPT